jgi:serine/threonine-protein kinase
MAAVIAFIQVAQAVLGDEGLGELSQPSYWVAAFSGLCWAALWLACKLVPMRARTLRIVEAVCIGGAVTALAVVTRLSPVEMFVALDGPELGNDEALSLTLLMTQRLSSLSVLIAMALAMAARAALVPTSPRHTAVLTGGVGIPLILVWVVHIDLFAIPANPGTPELYLSQGAGPGVTIAIVAVIWWLITTAVCYVISRVVHGLRVDVLAARKMGQYTLEEKLGEGGMGEVYRARHSRLRRPTAVKLLPVSRSSEQAVKRFEDEVQLTATLTHPNTITIFDYGRTNDGIFYYAMELLRGATLGQVVSIDGPQPAARVIKIIEQTAGALQEAHAAGLIHRDIKPANIMLTRQGNDPDAAKVLDFGLVRSINRGEDDAVTQDGNIVGTPLYMAPEAITAADSVGPLGDIYALGAVGYFLLTGTHVFSGANLVEMCAHHLHTEPEAIADRLGRPVDGDLETAVMQCLAKRPEDRPQGAAALITLLRRCKDHGGWTSEDAEAWWERNQPALDDLRSDDQPIAAASAAHTFTVST